MNVAEISALVALVRAETEGMVAENQYRAHGGYSPAYTNTDFWLNPATVRLREELERRGVVDKPEPSTAGRSEGEEG